MAIAAAVVVAGAAVGSTVAGAVGQQENADAQNAYNAKTYATQSAYRLKEEAYEDDTWQQDLDFATKNLNYEKNEFTRQATWVNAATSAALDNEKNNENQVMLRNVQNNVALSFQEFDTNRSAQTAGAATQSGADGRGVTGNSVNEVVQDVARQGGEANTILEMNRSASNEQSLQDLLQVKANGDSSLVSIGDSIKTYAPDTEVRTPAPIAPVIEGQAYAGANIAATAFGAIGGLAGGFSTYHALSTPPPASSTYQALGGHFG